VTTETGPATAEDGAGSTLTRSSNVDADPLKVDADPLKVDADPLKVDAGQVNLQPRSPRFEPAPGRAIPAPVSLETGENIVLTVSMRADARSVTVVARPPTTVTDAPVVGARP
jgi:hypothetical protein